jgi:hypothetical protein
VSGLTKIGGILALVRIV